MPVERVDRIMAELPLLDRTILITGAARRIGAAMARACATAGANVVVHDHHSERQATELQREISSMGRKAWAIKGDLAQPGEVLELAKQAFKAGPLFALI